MASHEPSAVCVREAQLKAFCTAVLMRLGVPSDEAALVSEVLVEADLRGVVERSLDLPDGDLSVRCEQTIRNYDPCISCATHFLRLDVERL